MRNEKTMLNTFMPINEKEWEARLFIDEAIKNKAEYTLEAVARALSGKSKIKFAYAEKEKPFEHRDHISGDEGKWITKTEKFAIEAKMDEFVFYGNTEMQLWLKIIDFWAGKVTVFPCGGASFPNEKLTCVHEDENNKTTILTQTQFPLANLMPIDKNKG